MGYMCVVKRDGRRERVQFSKIEKRIRHLANQAGKARLNVDPARVTQEVMKGVYDGVTTVELDTLAAETAASLVSTHHDYSILAARIAVSNLHKETDSSFATVMTKLRTLRNCRGDTAPMINDATFAALSAHADELDVMVQHGRDHDLTYFGFKTLENAYLLRDPQGKILERPQHMYLRVALGLWLDDMDQVRKTYELMSQGYYTHATPTLFNSGTPRNQLSSCFLKAMTAHEDSIEGIFDTLRTCALISKSAGGIGFSVHDVRAKGSYIAGTNGRSNGLVPMLRVFNDTARYVDQGGNKRPGAFAAYIEPWHADIFEVLDLRKNQGAFELRARDLHYALWVPDLFMRRVESGGDWTLMCPHDCPALADTWGAEFERLYERYERENKGRRVVKAQDLWKAIVTAQIETGEPYMLYKDAANRTSSQQHIGTIRSSNLCTEIIEFSGVNPRTGQHETAVCNLASVSLPRFVEAAAPDACDDEATSGSNTSSSSGGDADTEPQPMYVFNMRELHRVVQEIVRNLDRVIDIGYYPVHEARESNMAHRPMGIGVQGLADVFCMLRMPFTSPAARALNVAIAEVMYHAALTASCALAKRYGPYPMYDGSPAQARGQLHHDLWFQHNLREDHAAPLTVGWLDWRGLRADIAAHGLRNSLLIAHMPTASTSQILGNNEAFEPFTSNIYSRQTLTGAFQVVNKHLMRELQALHLWTPELREQIIKHKGSIQDIPGLPAWMYNVYRTVWEIPQRQLVEMAAERAPYIDQSQSFSVFIAEPNYAKITSMHFCAWRKGLKTGMYYLRTKAAAAPLQFTVRPDAASANDDAAAAGAGAAVNADAEITCSLQNRDECTACSS